MTSSPSPLYCRHCGAANPDGSVTCFACQYALDAPDNGEHQLEMLLKERYRVLAQVGTGGFGAVYRAIDSTLADRIVAIKQINLQGLTTQEKIEATDAFHREVRLLSGLKHPNLPGISDSFTDPEHWYIVMDFIEGETLEAYLKKRFSTSQQQGLPLKEVLALGLQLCIVLHYLHTREPPIIFRDLKPSNIMRTAAGQIYLIDFGIARHFIPGKPKDTIPFGSPGYAPPEQYGKAQTTPQADIYSLGALLHQVLSGDDPSESPFRFAPLRLYGAPELAELENLIQRMVQVDASERPASVAEVKEVLQRLAGAQERSEPRLWRPPETPPPLPAGYEGYRTWSTQIGAGQQQQAQATRSGFSRRRFVVAGLTLGSLALVGTGVVQLCRLLTAPHFSGVIANPNITPVHARLANYVFSSHSGAVTTIAWSPDGQMIASGSADKSVLVWSAADGMLLYRFIGYRSALTAVTWSFDDQYIASCGESDGTVQLWEALTGNDSHSFQEQSGRVLALAWSRDMATIASGGEDRVVWVWNPNNGDKIRAFSGHSGAIRAVAWSQDFTLASASADKTVRIWGSLQQQRAFVYRAHTAGVNALSWSPDGTQIASASDDGTVQVWNAADGSPVLTYRGHKGSVNAVTWLSQYSPYYHQETRIASGGEDGTVQVWDLTGKLLSTYTGHTGPIRTLASSRFLSDKRIASGSDDGTVHLWTPPE